jgi:hypothetical protein
MRCPMRNSLVVLLPGVLGLFTSILAPSPSLADDAAKQAKLSRQELEALWSDLYADDPAAANAVIKLYKNADASVPFLKEKLQPLELDADECRRLLKELGSNDEKVWKAAWETLDYLDPRLAIDLPTLMEEVTDVAARTRMVELCSQREADSLAGKNVTLRPVGDDGFNFFDGRGSWWAEHRVERIGGTSWNRKTAWTRAARGVAILEQINTAEAVEVLKQLAEGHPDAAPTKAAQESLERVLPVIDPFGK